MENSVPIESLRNEIEKFIATYESRHRLAFRTNIVLIITGLMLACGITVAGMYELGKLAAVLGTMVGFLVGIQNAFPLGEKAEFYRLVVVEASNLRLDLTAGKGVEKVIAEFGKLRKYAAASLPRGQGMEAVKEIYRESSGPG